MKSDNYKGLWIITVITLLLAIVVLTLGYQSFRATDKAAIDGFSPVFLQQQLVVGLSILTVLCGAAYALLLSLRTRKLLQKEVKKKTRDLAEAHKELQAALSKLQTVYAFQQSIIDSIAEPIMVIDANYQVKLMNRAAQEFSPQGIEDTEPVFCYQVSHQCEAPCKGRKHPCPMELIRQSGKPVTVIHEHVTANGEARFVEVMASPLWGEDGAFQGIIEATRDITDRKAQMEDALAEQAKLSLRSEDELGQFTHKIVKSLQEFLVEAPDS